jgi:hypothetical protein
VNQISLDSGLGPPISTVRIVVGGLDHACWVMRRSDDMRCRHSSRRIKAERRLGVVRG